MMVVGLLVMILVPVSLATLAFLAVRRRSVVTRALTPVLVVVVLALLAFAAMGGERMYHMFLHHLGME